MPKISVIVPVYNAEPYLKQCISSVLDQTLSGVEVICVDDGSKDRSYEILQNFSLVDSRVKVYRFEESKSALQARKLGVMEADGEYIMFLDADDFLEPVACEKLYSKIKKENVDILHFSSRIVNCANLSPQRIAINEKIVLPYETRLYGEDIFLACFNERKYHITLWNKIFRASLCKKAFGHMDDMYLPKAQDLYSYYVIANFAKSYLGWRSEPLHNYCIGRGVVGNATMDLDKFERYCSQANVVTALRTFDERQGNSEKNAPIIERYCNQWIVECIKLWKNELSTECAVAGWDILCKYWGSENVIACTAKLFWNQKTDIARKLNATPQLSLKDKTVKTIAFYYHRFTIGGVQRVISLLSTMFIKMGYEVVIITDSQPTSEDFPLPKGAKRASILNWSTVDSEHVKDRLDAWKELIREYKPDVVLYNAWASYMLLWDHLYLKSMGIPVVVHAHSVFSFSMNNMGKLFPELARTLALTDGMIVLSEADKVFWNAFNDNVHVIPNPISHELNEAKTAKWENNTLIWVGRVSDEKQPHAIFEIMGKVIKQVPDAHLLLLGNFDDPKWRNMAKNLGIEANTVFCGLTPDVYPYYEKASVYVSTSLYEGFLMTLLEAQAHGLPTVMFDMPNLSIASKDQGVISVDMLDSTSAASEIIKLLKNQEHWDKNSILAKQGYERLHNFNYESAWKSVLLGENATSTNTKPVNDMIHTFVNHYEQGCKYQEEYLPTYSAVASDIEDSLSYRIGRVITFIPRMIRGAILCCKENGISYTVKYTLEKIKNRLK